MKIKFRRLLMYLLSILLLSTGFAANAAETFKTLTLPAALQVIEEEAFCGNTSLEKVVVPEWTTRIGRRAFAQSSVREMVLPEGMLSIDDYAFADCTWLETINLPKSLLHIGEGIFENCPNLIVSVEENSAAHSWCVEHDIAYTLTGDDAGAVVYRALLIGNIYAGTGSELNGPDDDVEGFAKMLALQTGTPYRVTARIELTASEILNAISSTFADADSNDVSLFYYNGHGANSTNYADLGALCGIDNTYVTVAELRAQLDTVSGEKIVILDSCHSGAHIGKSIGGSAEAFNNDVIAAFSARSKENLAADRYTVLTACSQSEVSWELYNSFTGDESFGLFSQGICRGSGYDLEERNYCGMYADDYGNGNGKTSLEEAYEYAADLVDEYVRRVNVSAQNIQYYGNSGYVLWAHDGSYDPSVTPVPTSSPTPTPSPSPSPTPTPTPVTHTEVRYTLSDEGTAVITGVMPANAAWVTIPGEIDGYTVRAIGEGAFENCTALTAVSMPDSMTEIGARAFGGCTALEEINIPAGVCAIGAYAFENCAALGQIELHSDVTELGDGIFDGCGSLTVRVYEGSAAERYCIDNGYDYALISDSYEDMVIEGGVLVDYTGTAKKLIVPEGVTTIGYEAFALNETLEEIVLPDSLETIESAAFYWCEALRQIEIPGGIEAIPDYMLCGCSALECVVLPDSIESIGAYAFSGCESLSQINMPAGLISIDEGAFETCDALEAVVLPHGLKRIGSYAFASCEKLHTVFVPGSVTFIGRSEPFGSEKLVVQVEYGSYAEEYCIKNTVPYVVVN